MSVVFQEQQRVHTSWQCPKFEDDPFGDARLSWVNDAIREGEGYLENQKSYKNLAQNMRLFDGLFNDKTRSTLISNFLKYNIRKFVETISDVREIGTFGSDAPQYKQYANVTNNVLKCIFTESGYPRQLRRVLQYASVMGVGYLWPKCKAADYGFGERQIVFEPLGILDVLPVQVPSNNDTQDAYVNTVYEYMPIAEAHARFPLFQDQLLPVDQCSYPSRLTAKRLDWAEKFRYGDQTRNWGNLYCEIRYSFVRDLRINNTGYEMPMGDIDTSWFYKVPTIGQSIFAGIRNGQPYMRPAQAQDCRVYPNLRLIITSPGVRTPMYDGPAWDWHGKMPPVQYTVDDWPWEALGLSLVESVGSIERTKRKHERLMDQTIAARLNPPMGYDRTQVGGPKIENFDLFEPNVRMGGDGPPNQTFQSILPEEVAVTEINYQWLEYLKSIEEAQLGINDLGSIENLKMNLSPDSLDKVLETVGPIAMGIAASMEASNAKIAQMMKFMIPQWIDRKRLIQYVGPDKITQEMDDFDPMSMVPSHLEDEYVSGLLPTDEALDGTKVPRASMYDQLTRARVFASNLRLISVPDTLLKITQQAEMLKYLQLYRDGFPICPQTVAAKLGIENYGEAEGDTEFAKWEWWEGKKIELAAQAQQLTAELVPQAQGAPGAPNPTQPPPQPEGRPPSGKRPPKIVMKGKNTFQPRTTVTES